MNTQLVRIVLPCLAVLMSIPMLGQAKPGQRDGAGPRMDLVRLERMAEKLELDDATLSAIKKKLYAAQEVGIKLRGDLESAQLKVRQSMDQDEPNRDEVMANLEKLSAAQLKLRKHRTGVLLDVQAHLTPEQRKKVRRHIRNKGHKRGGHHRGKRHRKMGDSED